LKYLVTGGAGFIGSHLVERLISEGNSVVVLDDISTGDSGNLNSVLNHSNLRLEKDSILNLPKLDALIQETDRIFHLAATVGVFNIMQNTSKGIINNVIGTHNVLELARKYEKPVLLTSSSEIYGKNVKGPLTENSDRIIGSPQFLRWSYSDSKALDEALALAFASEFKLETRIVRLFNTSGPRQSPKFGMVLPRFVVSALANENIEIYGSGEQTRCFAHVADIIEGIMRTESTPNSINRPINLGNPIEISMLLLAKTVKRVTNSSSEIIFRDFKDIYGSQFEDMEKRVPDISLARELLDWKPVLNLDEIILDCANYWETRLNL
jgi:UDP-glucose 4-epimerase